jgi:hypothetical protein
MSIGAVATWSGASADPLRLLVAALARGGMSPYGRSWSAYTSRRRSTMILAVARVEDFDRFLRTFSTKGSEKRAEHGSKGATVFRDPDEEDRVWALFDWDEAGWQSFVSDPDTPAIFQEAGLKGRPQAATLAGRYDA